MGLVAVEILMGMEEAFGFELAEGDPEVYSFQTVGDLCDLAVKYGASMTLPEATLMQVQEILTRHLNVPEERITRDAHLVDDLGMSL